MANALPQLTCDQCLKVFLRKYNLERHKARVHQQKVTNVICQECGKDFSSTHNLKIHLQDIHNGKKMEADPKLILVGNKGNTIICFTVIFTNYE